MNSDPLSAETCFVVSVDGPLNSRDERIQEWLFGETFARDELGDSSAFESESLGAVTAEFGLDCRSRLRVSSARQIGCGRQSCLVMVLRCMTRLSLCAMS